MVTPTGPIPGENFTSDTKNYPWHRPPEFSDPDKAIEMIAKRLMSEESALGITTMLKMDTPVSSIVEMFLMSGVGAGKWSVDTALMLAGPVSHIICLMAEGDKIPYDMGIKDESIPITSATLKYLQKKATDVAVIQKALDDMTDALMAGFMSGFGSAFSKSFELASEARRQSEESEKDRASDIVRLRYQDYISTRDNRMKMEREDGALLKGAESIARNNNMPAENVPIILDMLRGGMSYDKANEWAQETEISVTSSANVATQDGSGVADPRDGLSQQASSAVDSDMQASGMVAPHDGGIFNPNLAQNAPAGPAPQTIDRNATGATAQDWSGVSEIAGVPEEQIAQTMDPTSYKPIPSASGLSYTTKKKPKITDPPSPNDVKSLDEARQYYEYVKRMGSPEEQAIGDQLLTQWTAYEFNDKKMTGRTEGTYVDPVRAVESVQGPDGKTVTEWVYPEQDGQGNIVYNRKDGTRATGELTPLSNQMEKEITELHEQLKPQIKETQTNISNAKNLLKVTGDIRRLSKANPEAIGMSGNVAQFADKWTRGMYNTINMFTNGVFDPVKSDQIINDPGFLSALNAAEKAAQESVSTVKDRVEKNALDATLLDIQATRWAYMMAKAQDPGGRLSNQDFQVWKEAALGLGRPEAINVTTKQLMTDIFDTLRSQVDTLNNNSTEEKVFLERHNLKNLPGSFIPNIEEDFKTDERLKSVYEEVFGPENTTTDAKQTPSDTPPGLSKEDALLWPGLSERGKELMKKQYGVK